MKYRVFLASVVLVVAVLLVWRSGWVPLLDPDESRFARTSVEMMRRADIVVPFFNGEPRLVKPPLIHWIQSFVFSRAGVSELAARMHSILATLGSIALVAWVARRRFGEESAGWAAAILGTMPLVLALGRVGTLDALLSVHILAAVALDLAPPSERVRFRSVAIGALLGLAFLIKGPIGVVLPLLILLAGRTASRRELLPGRGSLLNGTAAWCVVVLPWGLAFVRRVGAQRVLETVQAESLGSYFVEGLHPRPFWFFLVVVCIGFLPWIAPLISGIVRAWRLRDDVSARTALYAAAGMTAGLVFLSLGQSKLPSYILPLAPLAALIVTWELGRQLEIAPERATGSHLLAASVAALAVALGLASRFQLSGEPRHAALAGAAVFGLAAVVGGCGAIWRKPRIVFGTTAVAGAAFLLSTVVFLSPEIGRTRSARALIEQVPALSNPGPLVTVEVKIPSLGFYLDRVYEVLDMHQLGPRIAATDAPVFVFAEPDLHAIPAATRDRLEEIGRHGKYRVFEERKVPAP